jgi:hypothetical protein
MEGGVRTPWQPVSDRHKPRGRSRVCRFLHRPHRRFKLQDVDFLQHGHAPCCALTVSGQGEAFGSLAAAALRAGASGGDLPSAAASASLGDRAKPERRSYDGRVHCLQIERQEGDEQTALGRLK